MSNETIGAVILAAGGSVRLGEPKQFLLHRGETLVRRSAHAACSAGCTPVVVVAGDEWERIRKELAGLSGHTLHHPPWRQGIGSSLRTGVTHALALDPTLDALIVMVCDQPFVTAEILTALIAARVRMQKRGAACFYAGTVGVPALFDRSFFADLQALPDGQGAKHVLANRPDEIAHLEFPQGAFDIDTPSDRQAHLDATAY